MHVKMTRIESEVTVPKGCDEPSGTIHKSHQAAIFFFSTNIRNEDKTREIQKDGQERVIVPR
jgi:hypothetical protein